MATSSQALWFPLKKVAPAAGSNYENEAALVRFCAPISASHDRIRVTRHATATIDRALDRL